MIERLVPFAYHHTMTTRWNNLTTIDNDWLFGQHENYGNIHDYLEKGNGEIDRIGISPILKSIKIKQTKYKPKIISKTLVKTLEQIEYYNFQIELLNTWRKQWSNN